MPAATRVLMHVLGTVSLCLGTQGLPAWTRTNGSLCVDMQIKTKHATNLSACYALCAKTAGCSQFAATNANWPVEYGPACKLAPPCAHQCTTTPPWMPGKGYCKKWDTYTCLGGPAAHCAPAGPRPPIPPPPPKPPPPPPVRPLSN